MIDLNKPSDVVQQTTNVHPNNVLIGDREVGFASMGPRSWNAEKAVRASCLLAWSATSNCEWHRRQVG